MFTSKKTINNNLKNKKMSENKSTLKVIIGVIAALTITFLIFLKLKKKDSDSSKRSKIYSWSEKNDIGWPTKVKSMTDEEIEAFYDFIFVYKQNSDSVPKNSNTYNLMKQIGKKYLLFPNSFLD